jgi:2-polyprenyl-3-methyl-5-hydroxy-6-metoxy-1,4-benzoquinol methylase
VLEVNLCASSDARRLQEKSVYLPVLESLHKKFPYNDLLDCDFLYKLMWNHNSHFHSHLLRQFPCKIDRALDIGCGLGVFSLKLAEKSEFVDALDVDAEILQEALRQHNASNIFYQHADFLAADLPKNSYDAIVSIAAIHHMDLEAALNKMKILLRPSGRLLILGLYRETTIVDYMYSVVSVPLNLVYSIWHRESTAIPRRVAPTRPAQLSLKQIKTMSNNVIPGFRLQRHLFWRYSLIWQNVNSVLR